MILAKTIRPFALKGHGSIAHSASPLRAKGLIVNYCNLIYLAPLKYTLKSPESEIISLPGCLLEGLPDTLLLDQAGWPGLPLFKLLLTSPSFIITIEHLLDTIFKTIWNCNKQKTFIKRTKTWNFLKLESSWVAFFQKITSK